MANMVLLVIQLAVTVVVGIYFFRQLRQQKRAQPAAKAGEQPGAWSICAEMRGAHLSEPLGGEGAADPTFEDIIGQEEGIKSLKAILCGANPQHVLIYGPPGIGKTCAARLVLEAAKQSRGTPFAKGCALYRDGRDLRPL